MKLRRHMILICTLILTAGSVPAVAESFPEQEQEARRFSDRWNITVGGILADMKT